MKLTLGDVGMPLPSSVGLEEIERVILGVKCAVGATPLPGPVVGSDFGGGAVGVRDVGG